MGKREKSFNRKVAKVEEIIKSLSQEYHNKNPQNTWRYSLEAQILAKVQLELCVSARKAKEYVKLVKVKMKSFDSQNT